MLLKLELSPARFLGALKRREPLLLLCYAEPRIPHIGFIEGCIPVSRDIHCRGGGLQHQLGFPLTPFNPEVCESWLYMDLYLFISVRMCEFCPRIAPSPRKTVSICQLAPAGTKKNGRQ